MNILVTGGAGYIGSHTVRELIKEGHNPVIIDNLSTGNKESIPKGVKFIANNLGDYEVLDKLFTETKIDAVIHFAGHIAVGESVQNPIKYYYNNIKESLTLLKAMHKHNINKIVFSSSAAVYGMPKETPIKEDSQVQAINPYGYTKSFFEQVLTDMSKQGLQSISLRYFNAAGADHDIGEDHDPETHLIPLILQVALKQRDHLKLFGTDYETKDGSCIRDYVHVTDLAQAHIKALEKLEPGHKAYNLGSNTGFTNREIINLCKEITQREIPIIETERREGDPTILVASNEKAKQELDWEPKHDIKSIIESAWRWHRNNPKGFK